MGRSPDYKAAFLATYGPNADYYAPFQDNARRWYKESQERVYFMNHTLVNPPVDRDKEIHEVSDVFIHAVKETDEGVVVRGAKMVATGSALSNYNFVSYHGNVPIKKEEYALSFFAPMDHPNIKLLCRPSYEFMAAAVGSPFDYPLSSRFDENDSVLMFDDALIPWENFLIYRNLEIASTYHLTGFIWRAMLQGCTRLAVKLDFIAGVFIKALEATGTIAFRGIQASVGEILAWRNTFWALTDAMCHNPVPSAEGSVIPNNQAGLGLPDPLEHRDPEDQGDHREPGRRRDDRPALTRRRLEERGAAPAARPVLPRLQRLRGARQDQARQAPVGRCRISEFGGRHELYERTYSGSHELTRLECWWMAQGDGTVDRMKGFAEQCMAEYDLDGWTVDDLINPDDINLITGKVRVRAAARLATAPGAAPTAPRPPHPAGASMSSSKPITRWKRASAFHSPMVATQLDDRRL